VTVGCDAVDCDETIGGTTATAVGGAPLVLGAGRGGGVTVCRVALVACFVACDGAVFRATRSLGAGRSGFDAGRSALFGAGSATGGGGVLSTRAVVAGGVGDVATGVGRAPLAPVIESEPAGVVRDATLTAGAAGARPFPICHHASAKTSAVASTPAAVSSRRTMRTFAACCDRRIACSTVALSDTDDG
jgi:hypothetical protein